MMGGVWSGEAPNSMIADNLIAMGHDALASYNLPFFQCLANKDIMCYIEILYSTHQPSKFVEAGKLVTNYQDTPSV